MNSILKLFFGFILLCFLQERASAQANAQCGNAIPFCTGVPMQYPAATNAGSAPSGPCYNCLGSEPNPAWFFMQMSTGGPVSIALSANFDVDFCCWGPFTGLAGVCTNLTCSNVQSCSYSASNTETCTISNAVAGAYYMILITNYSNQTQNIDFSQTNGTQPGAGTTNCGIVCISTLTNSGAICSGQSNQLIAITNSAVTSYSINGPLGSITSGTLAPANNTITSAVASLTSSTTYTFTGSTGSSTCQSISTINVIDYPSFSVTPNSSICQGGNMTACVTFTGTNNNTSGYFYNWSGNLVSGNFSTASPGPGIFSPGQSCTTIYPSQITGSIATVLYSIAVTSQALSCPTTHTMLLTINNPLTPTLSLPAPLCTNHTSTLLTATPSGGVWSGNQALNPAGLFNPAAVPALGSNTVMYSVAVGTCNVSSTGTIEVSQYIPPTLTSSVTTFCGHDFTPFNLMGLVQNTTGVWTGTNVNSASGTFNPGSPTWPFYGSFTVPLSYSIPSVPDPTVCPSFTTLIVPIFNPVTPTITPQSPICNNSGTIQLAATPTLGGLWTSNGVSALTGVLSPTSFPTGGTYTVLYQYGQGTCVATNSTAIEIDEYRSSALTGSINNLCSNSNPVNLLSITQNTQGTWSGDFLASGNVNNNIFNPSSFVVLPTGNYTLTYNNNSYPNPATCPTSTSIVVSVLNPPYASILPVGPFCNINGSVQLTVTPSTGSWTPQAYLTSGGLFTPSLSPVGNVVVQYIIGTNTCNTQQSSTISIEGFVPATITGSIPNQCTTSSPVNLLPLTANTQGTWSGPGIYGASFSPSVAGTGTMTLSYHTASSPSGLCPDQSTVAVSVFSLATPVISNIGPFCSASLPVRLNVSPLGGVFGGANTSAVDANGLFIPSTAHIGSNIVNYSITSGPCIAYTQATISVEKFVSADFTTANVGPFCKNDPRLARNLNEYAANPGGQWTGSGVNGNGLFTFVNATVGHNLITHGTHSEPTASLCPDTKTLDIEVYDTPTVSITASNPQGCAPFNAQLHANSNFGEGTWVFSDNSSESSGLTATHVFATPGTYSVSFTYSQMVAADLACVTQNTFGPIEVFATPEVDFSAPDEVKLSEPTAQLINTSSSAEHYRYSWTINGNGLNETLQDIDPTITLPNTGDYVVTLSATSLNSCRAQATKIIHVITEFNVYIPGSFTPNGDGLNDYFLPVFSEYGTDDSAYELMIFDRWGAMIFDTKDKTQGWDGKKSGQPVKQDVYVFKVKYKDVSGNVYTKTGFISVIR